MSREMEHVDGTTQMEVRHNQSLLLWKVYFKTTNMAGDVKKHEWETLAGCDMQALARCMQFHPDLDFKTAEVILWRRKI